MIRFLVNAVGSLVLALALVFAVGDIARSMAQGGVRLTPLGEAFGAVGLSIEASSGATGDLALVVGAWPAAPVLGALAFLVLLVGRPRRRGDARFR